MNQKYEYRERDVELDKDKQFRLGEGKISGYSSVLLGVLSLLGVIAYLFPSYLTTTELRKVYDAETLQNVLKYGMYFSLFFGVLTFILQKFRSLGSLGIILTAIAFVLGGYTLPVAEVDPRLSRLCLHLYHNGKALSQI